MPVYGSSPIPNELVFSDITYVTGPTGNTGASGLTGFSLTGSTGNTGPLFVGASIAGYTFGITYGSSGFFFTVTGPSGSSQRITGVTFEVRELGNPDAYSIFSGFDSLDTYKFNFKTIKVSGEATGGISGNAFYISSFAGITNSTVGTTGSLFYVSPGLGGFGTAIDSTSDLVTNYYRSIITPSVGSNLGITLDTFSYKQKQHFDTQFFAGVTANLNWINSSILNVITRLNNNNIKNSETFNQPYNRTDQSVFITVANSIGRDLYPKISFRAEGITLNSSSTQYNPIQVDIVGKGITYSLGYTYKNSLVGSCCYCSQEADEMTISRKCLDYCNKDFCDQINGSFGFKSCVERYESGDCYSGGACCVNNVCLETNKELCDKVFGTFYPNAQCNKLEFGCPQTCPSTFMASCCYNGTCYSVPDNESGKDLCDELGGRFSNEETCGTRNCCAEAILGACCLNQDDCVDNVTPKECKDLNGVFQGAGTLCSTTTCCVSVPSQPLLKSYTTKNNFEISENLKVGDFFEGGIIAGFIGYPNPKSIIGEDSFFAKGQIISDLENKEVSYLKTYVPVTGVFTNTNRCNCNNFSPSRYVTSKELAKSNGKVLVSDVKSLSAINDEYKLSFYNRLSDTCLVNENRPCNEKSSEFRKYGFNSIQAYKNLAKQIHGEQIPNGWILIVSPEDISSENVSFGMSMSVNGFNIPSGFENYSSELWQNNVLTPYGTTVFDGLVNTRLFDETSIERNTWFISKTYTINGSIKTLDPLAVYRFKHSKTSYWQSEIDENKMISDSSYFKEKYKEMWYAINTETTALRLISEKNKENYNGYSDWYIPSAVEMNVIYNNINRINDSIVYQNNKEYDIINKNNNYWTSTTGGKLSKFIGNNQNIRLYQSPDQTLESIQTSSDGILDSWKSYKLSQAHRAYIQNMSTGSMISSLKNTSSAKLRACRMIPTYFKNQDTSNQFEFSFNSLNTCSSCK